MAGFWSWLDYWQMLIAGAFTRDSGLDHWQTLIAGAIGGVLTLVAGVVAYRGARSAAKRQIKAMQAEREITDDRRRIVAEWAVRAEADRLDTEITRVDRLWKKKISEIPARDFIIDSSPLLRGGREDVALLDDKVKILGKIDSIIGQYNHRAGIAVDMTVRGLPQAKELREACYNFLQQLYALTVELKK